MEKSTTLEYTKKTLDLREGREQIEQKNIENIINRKERGNYWWHDDTYITTLENGKITHYKINETVILLNKKNKKDFTIKTIKKEKKSELLTDLFLCPNNQVSCTAEAFEKAKYSNNTNFWFISKGKNKAVIVLDFSEGKKPKKTIYPLDKYNIKTKPISI